VSDDDAETKLRPRTAAREVPALDLVVVAGADRGARASIGASIRVGTAQGNDLRLTDRTVSRVHATFSSESEGVRLRDLGSTNGTFIDGVRVKDGFVAAGNLVRLGDTTLRAEPLAEPVAVELSTRDRLGRLVGGSPAMRRVYAMIERVAPTMTTVLVQGETGTGKELVARAIHDLSRRQGRFLALDCGAIPETLVESELFGHARGSFSGAVADRAGVFEEASGGTLFFDEVGELTAPMQRKLLRALESREIRRVGESRERAVDVRVVAATHRPLEIATNEGLFREDLYFRLAVVTIELPPLRARREDIPVIAQAFLERLTGGTETIGPELTAALVGRSWNGNVRELRNYLESRWALSASSGGRAAATTASPPSSAEDWVKVELPFKEAQAHVLERFENAYLRALLARSGGNVSHAARVGGVSRRFLQRRMIELGLREETPEDE
jgi:DNA-binding NtrC family response regulator